MNWADSNRRLEQVAVPIVELIALITNQKHLPWLFLWIRKDKPKPSELSQLSPEEQTKFGEWLSKNEQKNKQTWPGLLGSYDTLGNQDCKPWAMHSIQNCSVRRSTSSTSSAWSRTVSATYQTQHSKLLHRASLCFIRSFVGTRPRER